MKRDNKCFFIVHLRRIILKIRQQISICQLLNSKVYGISLCPLSKDVMNTYYEVDKLFEIIIFGKKIDHQAINWHCDYKSGYCYCAEKRFDKLKINKLFNQGIEVKFPWELSRFNFGIDLALHYRQSSDLKYYILFKNLVTNWLEKNKFLMGVNWICTMEVAIRAANWIVAANLFESVFWRDDTFVCMMSKSLFQHALYINKFPEKFPLSENNHLIADYSGLFVLAFSFRHTSMGKRLLEIAKRGLIYCMEKQIGEDGINFEHTIPYHRLTLEFLAVPVLLEESTGFPKTYYKKLFRMFEFVTAYTDSNGNAPQIGDNDSGRFLKLSNSEEQNHRYLLEIGQEIFDYHFDLETANSSNLIPVIKNGFTKINLPETGIIPRNCNQSVFFPDSGFYFLKNELFSLAIYCPTRNQGGHRHFDSGSFTLSYKGTPIVVDPGTGVYTSTLVIRNYFRDYFSHNMYYKDEWNEYNHHYFDIVDNLDVKVVSYTDRFVLIRMSFDAGLSVERKFILSEDALFIQDQIKGNREKLVSAIHFELPVFIEPGNRKIRVGEVEIFICGAKELSKKNYLFSPSYSIMECREKIVVLPNDSVTLDFHAC